LVTGKIRRWFPHVSLTKDVEFGNGVPHGPKEFHGISKTQMFAGLHPMLDS
jgi:hypothetical protein